VNSFRNSLNGKLFACLFFANRNNAFEKTRSVTRLISAGTILELLPYVGNISNSRVLSVFTIFLQSYHYTALLSLYPSQFVAYKRQDEFELLMHDLGYKRTEKSALLGAGHTGGEFRTYNP